MNTRTNTNTSARRTGRSQASGNRAQSGNPAQWRQSFERYCALALSESDDRVARENYYQYAEHYLRLMHEAEAVA